MTGVGSVADMVQLPDAEISTDNATSSITTTSSGQRPILQRVVERVSYKCEGSATNVVDMQLGSIQVG
jgi:hypothetical protein